MSSQYKLLGERRFAALFWTQFLGAANDNLFKFAFTLLATYQAAQWGGFDSKSVGFVIAAIFILPYILFSATSGQIADKIEKGTLMRFVKSLEILIMAVAAYGFATHHAVALLICVFLMGCHSTLFGPVKYAYLPQHLSTSELTGGNGLVEMGTFVAILLGTMAGGILVSEVGATAVAWSCVGLAVVGRIASQFVPNSPAPAPDLAINWNPISETWNNLKIAARRKSVFNSLIGISWLWFFGSIFLTSFTPFARDTLHGDENVVTLLLAIFSFG
ncbi:MAG TPA: MFS transporter, partial [Usitatibacter sp.]